MSNAASAWPDLSYADGRETWETMQLITQMVGKVRLAHSPWVNHGWHVTLYVTAQGFGTGLVSLGGQGFELELNLGSHELDVRTAEGKVAHVPLRSGSIARFHAELQAALAGMGLPARFDRAPNEMAEAVPFARDMRERAYDPAQAQALWRAMLQADRVFKRFRTRWLGKVSPVHLFWGAFDLAVTRFSGRPAPPHAGGVPHLPDAVVREAYSHEVSSAGFWPGGGGVDEPAFYAYAYPEPAGFRDAAVLPARAGYNAALGEFVLPYAAVRQAVDPDAALLAFLQSTYEAAADRADWDRAALECPEGRLGVPRWTPDA